MNSKQHPNTNSNSNSNSNLNASPVTRVFLGLDQPPLISATHWFLQHQTTHASGAKQLDLSQTIVVLPSARSQQRLLQLLISNTDTANIQLTPPIITTLGSLPEYLYVAEKSLATELAQQIAWSQALAKTTPDELEQLTGRPASEQPTDWQPLAAMISKLHTRLANDIWSFSSVARAVAADTGFLRSEASRWEALNQIQKRYYKILYEVDLWDKQAARNYAAGGLMKANEIRCRTNKTIVMLGTADLNRSVAEMLRQIATTHPSAVQILIAAAPEMADRFDAFGSLLTEQWLPVPIKLNDDQIRIADQPADQAHAVAEYLQNLPQPFSTDEITIGVPDEALVPQLQRVLSAMDIPHRHLAGRRLNETAPVKLLMACRDYLKSYSFDALAVLVRHPDMFHWLCDCVDSQSWLTDLTAYQNANLPGAIRLDEKNPFGNPAAIAKRFDPTDPGSKRRAEQSADATKVLNQLHENLIRLLKPLDGQPQPIADWVAPWSDVLLEIYGERELDKDNAADRQTLIACDAIYDAFGEQQQIPDQFATITTAMQALEMALSAANEQRVTAPPIPTAIELAGWLDLTLDDAPVMVVTGFNDEHVPTSEVGHQFLPNELCKQLGVLDNDRRFARDCYALTVITSVREHWQLIVGRRDDQGEPMKPSRLLFSDSSDVAAQRARDFFRFTGDQQTKFWLADEADCPTEQQFIVPEPIIVKPITQISVTKFRDFIKCPYRFYLKHGLGLESMTDDWRELDGGKFGDLAHNCLEAFGKSDIRETTDVQTIFDFLNDQLNTFVSQQFGGSRLPAVKIQIEQLRLRFDRFAKRQSTQRAAGWQIVSTEEMLEHDFDVDGTPFRIRGKIDRVDQHEITNQIAVWDYKSSDKGDPPDKVHYASRKKVWKDLQLPLYRHLVKEVTAVAGGDFSNVMMGYILLAKNLDNIDFFSASWSAEELNSADETARSIIRQIRQSQFWPPAEKPPLYSEEFAAICQDTVFERAMGASSHRVTSSTRISATGVAQ